MNSIKYTAQSQGVIDSIKNQKNKSHIRCVYKGLGTDTTIYCFFHEDIDNNLKVFKIQDDYEKADLDCDLIFKPADNDPDPTNKDKKFIKKFNKYQLGVITV